MYTVKESYEWMAPEFKIVDAGKNTIRIRGVAMRGNVVSRNKRKYVADELKRAARTFIGRPITINHDPDKKVGTIKWMEYSDESDALEYLGDIKKQPYVDMIRNKSTFIKGVSIEADYLHNQCTQCGARFYTEEDFHRHMHEVHFIKTDPTTEPHGMLGKALSLVLGKEEPGYSDSTIELMEMYKTKPILQLLEIVTKNRKETVNYLKQIGKTIKKTEKPKNIPYKIRETREQKETPAKEPCPAGEHRDAETGECIPDATPEVTEQEKLPTDATQAEGDTEKLACADGFHLETDDLGNQKCVADLPPPPVEGPVRAAEQVEAEPQPPIPEQPTQLTCPEGKHLDPETGLCIEDTTVVEPLPNVFEVVLPTLLKLGEPFANYKDFADCVAKNPDKENPDAYCADIKRKTEGETVKETAPTKDVYESLIVLDKDLTGVSRRSIKRDVQQAETLNKLNVATAKQHKNQRLSNDYNKKTFDELNRQFYTERNKTHKLLVGANGRLKTQATTSKQLKETIITNNATVTKTLKSLEKYMTHKLGQIATASAVNAKAIKVNAKLALLAPTIKSLQTSVKKLKEQEDNKCPEGQHRDEEGKCVPDTAAEEIATLKEKVNENSSKIEETTNLATKQKEDFEKILAFADKNIQAKDEKIRTLEEWKAAKEQEDEKCPEGQHRDEEGKCVDDVTTEEKIEKRLKEMLEPYKTKIENLEAKQKGVFKAGHKPIEEASQEPSKFDPYDPSKKGKKK